MAFDKYPGHGKRYSFVTQILESHITIRNIFRFYRCDGSLSSGQTRELPGAADRASHILPFLDATMSIVYLPVPFRCGSIAEVVGKTPMRLPTMGKKKQ